MTLNTMSADVGAIRLPEEPRGRAVADYGKPAAQPALPSGATGEAPALTGTTSGGDAPAGADPQAWLGLTPEERAYFARLASEGRLSYGPVDRAGESPLYRGRHLSMRV